MKLFDKIKTTLLSQYSAKLHHLSIININKTATIKQPN